MDVVEMLRGMAAAAEACWLAEPDGDRKETMRELSDALREAAAARLQVRLPEGSAPVRSFAVHLVEDPSEF